MAAISISPLPQSLSTMSGRRAPLAVNNNAANSPYRATAAPTAQKQKRSFSAIQREDPYGQPPPKKQMLDVRQALRTPPRQNSTQTSVEGRVFTRRSNAPQQTDFERKCVASSRERPAVRLASQRVVVKEDHTAEENLETMKTWRKHTKKSFPNYVFYFENVPAEVHHKVAKQVMSLGAREEKFFSNAVTHVVTTRSIPPEHAASSATSSSANRSQSQQSQVHSSQTINPSLLDRSSESTNASLGARGKFTFEPPMNRRLASHGQDGELKKQPTRNTDVLYRARELRMKIWALEKVQRMMSVMFEVDTPTVHGHNTRGNSVVNATSKPADLAQLLRNERMNGPSDRDPTVATKELNLFNGPYIYIRDIDEQQRPIMVREYTKVVNKSEGEWPQFRSVAGGKCPFVPEVDNSRRDAEKELLRQQEKEKALVPRTRAATAAVEATRMQPPQTLATKRPLIEIGPGSNRSATVSTKQSNPFDSSRSTNTFRSGTEASSKGPQNAFVSGRVATGRLFAGEPVASGIQPSALTSAIQSQMISSTAAQPGAKTGTSKELHGLQRKVFKTTGTTSYGQAATHRLADISLATRDDSTVRASSRKLGLIEEDVDPSETEDNARRVEAARKAKAVQQRKAEKRDAKPGYCENCQDKFEDFDEHILSRKHRKFAEKADNWRDLDALLNSLARPLAQDRY